MLQIQRLNHCALFLGLLTSLICTHVNAQQVIDEKIDLWSFGQQASWLVHWPSSQGEKPFEVQRTADYTMLSVHPTSKKLNLPFFSAAFKSKPRMIGMTQLMLEIELLSQTSVTLNPCLSDATNEGLMFKTTEIKPGRHIYTWDMQKDIVHAWSGNGNRKIDGDLRLWSLNLTVPKNSPKIQLRFYNATAIQRLHPLEQVKATVQTGHPLFLVIPQSKTKPTLTLVNNNSQPLKITAQLTLKLYDESTTQQLIPVHLQAHQTVELPIADDSSTMGIRWLSYQLTTPDGYRVKGGNSYAVMQPAGPTPGRAKGFLFGICQHSSRFSDSIRDLEMQAAATCGAKVIRDFISWGAIEQRKGVFNWKKADAFLEAAEKVHCELQPALGLCAKWAAPEEGIKEGGWQFQFYPPSDMQAYAKYASQCARRYKGRIRFWEIWNEPDLTFFWRGSTQQYIDMLKLSYQAIKKADPQAMVLTGGFAGFGGHHSGNNRNPGLHPKVLDKAQDSYDVYAVHQHGTFDVFRKRIEEYLPIYTKPIRSHKPIYFNETAMHCVGFTEQQQAQTLFKKLLYTWSIGAMGYTWYDLRNDGISPSNPEHNYGMIKQDFHPKAVYCMYNTLAANLSGKTFVSKLNTSPDTYSYLFREKESFVLGSWIESESVSSQLITLKVHPGALAWRVDAMGSQIPVLVHQGIINFKIDHEPAMLVMQNTNECQQIDSIITLPQSLTVKPDQQLNCPIRISNPLDHEVSVSLNIQLPKSLKLSNTKVFMKPVKVGKLQKKTIIVTLKPGTRPSDTVIGKPIPITIDYTLEPAGIKNQMSVPVNWDIWVNANGLNNPSPLFWLHTQQQVVSIGAHDPSKAHLVWQGEKDLNARIWMGWKNEQLLLKVLVEDDIHDQSFANNDIWKADSIQMGMQFSGQKGYWEMGFARSNSGKSIVNNMIHPVGLPGISTRINLQTIRKNKQTLYKIAIPMNALKIKTEVLKKQGMTFNMIVNDSDHKGRKGWIQIGPGIGESKQPQKFTKIYFN